MSDTDDQTIHDPNAAEYIERNYERIAIAERERQWSGITERRQHVYLMMEIVRFSIAGILTLLAVIVGLVIFIISPDDNAKIWALSLMQSAFFAGIGYSFGSANSSSGGARASSSDEG